MARTGVQAGAAPPRRMARTRGQTDRGENVPAPTSCTVCEHPQREQIDVALRGGTSVRSICKAFDVGRTAVSGHAAKHTTALETRKYREAARGGRRRPLEASAPALKPIDSPEDVVEDLQRLRIESFELFEKAKARADWKSAERIFGQVVAVVDRFGEMHKVLGSKGISVTVDRSTRVLNVLGGLSEAELRALLVRAEAGETVALPEVLDAD